MKEDSKGGFSLLVVIFVILLLSAITAAAFLFTADRPASDSTLSRDTVSNTHAIIWPWSILEEKSSSPALELINDDEILSKNSINSFAKNMLLSSSHSTVPNSAIDTADFSSETMITEEDFHIWIKDKTITAYDNSEYVTGFFGFSGEYDVCFSAYCIRKSALSEEDVWTECTDDEIIELFTKQEGENVYYDAPTEAEAEAEAFIKVNENVYPISLTFIDITLAYVDRIISLSGFESIGSDIISEFADAFNTNELRAYKNGELMMLYLNTIDQFKLYLFYDLGTQTYCGWIRN
ncbi:MAG: hypothetical protein IJC50_03705 [Clostridia bacterium]|nr:hypothetical protein [Clostridia bacterium]